jgi:hypothetical protein
LGISAYVFSKVGKLPKLLCSYFLLFVGVISQFIAPLEGIMVSTTVKEMIFHPDESLNFRMIAFVFIFLSFFIIYI